jgi:hypothetical protein
MGHSRDIIAFLVGLFIGAPVGIVLTCILAIGTCKRHGTDRA